MLRLINLDKVYYPDKSSTVHAINNLSAEIYSQELTAIIGVSGSGKSTLLNIIGGLDKEYSGKYFYNDTCISELDEDALSDYRKDSIGFIFQHFNLINHLTALENVLLSLSMFDINNKTKILMAKKSLEDVGLGKNMNQKANELSGGQKQRVAIARALVKEPSIILADEPTGALDSTTSEEILNLLKEIVKKKSKIVILITHNKDIAKQCNRIIELKDGRIVNDNITSENKIEDSDNINIKQRKFSVKEAIHLSWHRINSKRWRYILVSIGGIIGLCGLALSMMISLGINDYVEEAYDKIVDRREIHISTNSRHISSDEYFDILRMNNINLVQSEHNINARLEIDYEFKNFTVKALHKVDNRGKYSTPQTILGRLPSDDVNEIALAKDVAESLLSEDEELTNLIEKDVEVNFLSPDTVTNYPARWDKQSVKVTGILESSLLGESISYIGYDFHTSVVKRSRFVGKNENILTNNYKVYASNIESVEQVAKDLHESSNYTIIKPEDKIKNIKSTFSLLQYGITGGAVLILIIGCIMVGIILFISVLERKKEIGILKALGAREKDIRNIFFVEGAIIGIFSAIIGILLSVILMFFIRRFKDKIILASLLKINILIVIAVLLVGLLVHLIATIIPANKAGKLNPIDLLRD